MRSPLPVARRDVRADRRPVFSAELDKSQVMTASQEAPALGQNSAVFVTGAARSDGREWWAPQVQPDEVPDSAILNADGRSLLFGFHEPAARGKEALEAIAAAGQVQLPSGHRMMDRVHNAMATLLDASEPEGLVPCGEEGGTEGTPHSSQVCFDFNVLCRLPRPIQGTRPYFFLHN